jgi:hypothetical protein
VNAKRPDRYHEMHQSTDRNGQHPEPPRKHPRFSHGWWRARDRKCETTALAEADLNAICRHIRDDFPTRATEWRQGLVQAAQALAQVPCRDPLALQRAARLSTFGPRRHGRYRIVVTITQPTVLRPAQSSYHRTDADRRRNLRKPQSGMPFATPSR